MNEHSPRAEDVIAAVERRRGAACTTCSVHLIGHDTVVGMMLGFADEALCLACLAARHDREPAGFLEAAHQNILRLACYRAGWRHADHLLAAGGPWPEERVPFRLRMPEGDEDDGEPDGDAARPHPGAEVTPLEAALSATEALERWDAGDRGCGELALELRLRVRRLAVGERLLLTTTDPGAPADLPAWCRLTGNLLVAAAPPRYLIEAGAAPAAP